MRTVPVTLGISCSTQISSTLAFWSPCFPFPVFLTPSYRVLSCVCYKCSRCLVARGDIPEDEFEIDNCHRLARVFKYAKTVKVCDQAKGGCGCPRAQYHREG